ncbi:MAG TPA: hypothetical protein PLP25_02515 [Candidatus Limiplasma sp.]|nr:hypothetical protein [Candidatus Limiplasma sp.]HPS80720.1 hypothetical protein [Candidatus Limiplasma sp.]
MQFALLVKSHANVRYAQSLLKLATLECKCLLYAFNATAEVRVEMLGGSPFLILETEEMDEEHWGYLSRHSAISFAAVKQEEWLRPLPLKPPAYLEPDLAQVLKYKGKTNADFTAMMLHCARSASAFAFTQTPLTVMDPVCGRGTSLFCALEEGDCAIGIETDEKAVHEADVYLERYLQFHRYKHRREESSLTLRKGGALKKRSFTLSNSPEAYKAGKTVTLELVRGDTALADEIAGAQRCHLIVADWPYGVQHAPKDSRESISLAGLLRSAMPAYCRALMPGGAIAVAFNTFTLPRAAVVAEMKNAGLTPLEQPPFDDFSHWVEQAVNRDMVIAVKKPRKQT